VPLLYHAKKNDESGMALRLARPPTGPNQRNEATSWA
jgi:hypothetical protein